MRHGRRSLSFSAIAACIHSAIAFACAVPPSETLSCRCIRGATRFIGVVARCNCAGWGPSSMRVLALSQATLLRCLLLPRWLCIVASLGLTSFHLSD